MENVIIDLEGKGRKLAMVLYEVLIGNRWWVRSKN
jgi:hypothetical protein